MAADDTLVLFVAALVVLSFGLLALDWWQGRAR